jgi:hypothetical protein
VTKGVADHAGITSFTGTEAGATHQENSGGTGALPAIGQPLNVTCMKAHWFQTQRQSTALTDKEKESGRMPGPPILRNVDIR